MARSLALAVPAVLLVSQGAQIVAAPATVPLLVWAARRTTSVLYRIAALVVGMATLLFVGWFVAYGVWGIGR